MVTGKIRSSYQFPAHLQLPVQAMPSDPPGFPCPGRTRILIPRRGGGTPAGCLTCGQILKKLTYLKS
jgi:hypothetical protein